MSKPLRFGYIYTKEENTFIKEHASLNNVLWISKKLNRTVSGLRQQMAKLGVADSHAEAGTYSANALSHIVGVSYNTIYNWIEIKELPAKKKSYQVNVKKQHKHYHILAEDFWKWAEKHKDFVEFNKIKPQTLLPEPEWVEEERKRQFYKPNKQKIWTTKEDVLLWKLYYNGIKQKEIAEKLNRTVNSVERRLNRLRKTKYYK